MAQTVFHGSLLQSGSVPTTALGSGVVSSSVQMTTLLPVGIVSSSAQLPAGTVSSSAQVPASNPVQYITSSNPIITVNPTAANVFWANTASGEFFMNISTASNANEWVGSSGSYVFPATALTSDHKVIYSAYGTEIANRKCAARKKRMNFVAATCCNRATRCDNVRAEAICD